MLLAKKYCDACEFVKVRPYVENITFGFFCSDTPQNHSSGHRSDNITLTDVYVKVVSAWFSELTLEEYDRKIIEDRCSFNRVWLYDGADDQATNLGSFCTVPRTTINSTGRYLLVVSDSASRNNDGRFSLSWELHPRGWFTSLVAGPLVWNSFAANLLSASVSLRTFAGKLKTYLFQLP